MSAGRHAAGTMLERRLHLAWLPWFRARDSHLDHGHHPYSAWEAELTAYARLRVGAPLKVRFGHTGEITWDEEAHLHRPSATTPPDEALGQAELELEHALMHYRHGWREAALLWHAWAYPGETVILPWPPWDQVPLPSSLVRSALEHADAAFSLGELGGLAPERVCHAARWLAAAWADGAHRALEVGDRPGLAGRLPHPAAPAKPRVWDSVLLRLAGAPDARRAPPGPAADALDALCACPPDDMRRHVTAVLALAQALGRAGALPAVSQQRPPWLRPLWGRWHRERELRRELERLARSPETAAIASITARARALTPRSAGGRFGSLNVGSAGPGTSGAGRPSPERDDDVPASAAPQPLPEGWGITPPPSLPEQGQPSPASLPGTTAEGSGEGQTAGATTGAGPGTLGALHVVRPTPADRAAYWQLRGALAPEIERLIERFEAAGNLLDRAAPRRFQRRGRIDRARLAAPSAGREAVFVRRVHTPEPEHALCILLDCSASMTTYAELLREMAILCEAAASAVGAHVTAFSFGPAWERMEPLAFGAPLVALGRELRPHGGTPFGPALQSAAAWLAQQPFQQKRLWVFSDGRWSARDRAASGWRPDQLTNSVVWVLSGESPAPPHPAMRIEPAPSLAELVAAAPRLFWLPPGGGLDAALGGAGEIQVHH